MSRLFKTALAIAAMTALLCGCSVSTVDDMYCPPKRSRDYEQMQVLIDSAMVGLEYCAPRSGENQQTVQIADLNGDGVSEYILFAKGDSEFPLQMMIFCKTEDGYAHTETIQGYGSSFDQVEYVQIDGRPGLEIVVGRQVSDQVVRSISVYSFASGQSEQLLSTSYTKFQTGDLDGDGLQELMILHPGETEEDHGIAAYYSFSNGAMERSCEVSMSESVSKLKRILWGSLSDGIPAVYVASAVDESSMITDVFAIVDGIFTNVSFSNESGTSVQTLRNYYVYAEDIDKDGIVELPDLISMSWGDIAAYSNEVQHLIRWYSMKSDGSEINKLYTYHNFAGGWYLELDESWIHRLSVNQNGTGYSFYLWDKDYLEAEKIMTIFTLTGQDRQAQAAEDGLIILYEGEGVIYAAELDVQAEYYNDARDNLINHFHLIHRDWKTGET